MNLEWNVGMKGLNKSILYCICVTEYFILFLYYKKPYFYDL